MSVVRIRRSGNKVVQDCDLYIGRQMYQGGWRLAQSIWANPFKIGNPGIPDAETAVQRYWFWLHEPAQAELLARVPELKGLTLGCWCKNSGPEPCHGDVLVYLASGVTNPAMQRILASTSEAKLSSSNPVTAAPEAKLSRIRAGLIGLALGDALGVPHEFGGSDPYTGSLYLRFSLRQRFQAPKTLAVGQYSDDTEMALVLARSLAARNGYDAKFVIENYIWWAQSGQPMMGKNTRALLKGNLGTKYDPTGIQHYQTKFTKLFSLGSGDYFTATSPAAEKAQSNGSLMRCWPLACLSESKFQEAVVQDVWCTNPSTVVLMAEWIYLNCVRMAIDGTSAIEIWQYAAKTGQACQVPEVRLVFEALLAGAKWDLVYHQGIRVKGWVCFGLYAAMRCLQALASESPPTWSQMLAWVIQHPGSDTDTNAAIAGGLVGSILGWEALLSDPVTVTNIETMLLSTSRAPTDVPRAGIYQLLDAENLVEALAQLT